MPGKILVVGSLNMDLVATVPRHPEIGETLLGSKFATIPGGKGANQAIAAARMGAAVTMVGCLGQDGFGEQLRQNLRQEGVEARYVVSLPTETTGIALIAVDQAGRNSIIVVAGANYALVPEALIAAEAAFSNADVLILQLESPLETARAAIRMARQHGLKVVLNPAPAQRLEPELLQSVDYLIPNEREAIQIVEAESLDAGIARIMEAGVRNLIVTLGDRGVRVVSRDGCWALPAHQVEALDTVAAGDTFVGAFAAGLVNGRRMENAIRLANAAAAISVTRLGAQPSLPYHAEVDRFLEQASVRN
jgi:ribokinase